MSQPDGAPLLSDGDVLRAVEAEVEWMDDLLARLVAVPTLLGAEEPGQALVASTLHELGLDPVDVWMDADQLRPHPAAAPFSWDVSGKRNVVATWAAGADATDDDSASPRRSLALNAHIDVVPPAAEALWTAPPFEPVRSGEWLVGRGSGDMKAGLAAMLAAVKALRTFGVAPGADVQLQSVVEEECGGNGALQCALALPRPDAVVIPEPYPEAISVSQVGVLWFQVELLGLPAHVGDAADGVDAIEAAMRVVKALRELEVELNAAPPPPYDTFDHPINLNIGMIRGGDWASTVPAACTLHCRLALYPGQQVAALQARVEQAVAATAVEDPFLARHPPTVRYDGFAGRGVEVAHDAAIVRALVAAHSSALGTPPELVPSTATTDARAFVECGIPAVCHGPLAERIHGIDERVYLPSVTQTAQVFALLIRDWCGLVA